MRFDESAPDRRVIDQLPSAPAWVSVDTETSGLHPDDGARVACVAVTWPDYPETGSAIDYELAEFKTLAFPFDQGVRDKLPTTQLDFDFSGNQGRDPNLTGVEWRGLLEWLREQKLIFHNAKFDLTMLRAGTRHWRGVDLEPSLYWDTMLTQRILDPIERAGLDVTCKRLGIGSKQNLQVLKKWLKSQGFKPNRYDLAPWSVVEPYVTSDTEMTAELAAYQFDRIEEMEDSEREELDRRVKLELAKTIALYRMEGRGVRYDDVKSLEAAEILEKQADALEKTMPFHCTLTEAHNYFYGKMKLDADRVSDKTGRPSLDEEQVRKWVKEGIPWAKEYAEVTKKRRAVSMWYRGYPEKLGLDGRLRTSYRQGQSLDGRDAAVKSGRFSVERVQLQAIPKKDKNIEGIPGVRELILAEDGNGLWNLDLSQAELRVATHYARCERMAEMLANGVDAHGETAKQVLHTDPDSPEWKAKRDIAKRLNFGGIFQIGGETFQKTLAKLADIHLPVEECYDYVNGWRRMYPEFGYAYRKAEQAAKEKGRVRLLPNTRFEVISWFRETDYPNSAWNRVVQGSLAEAFGVWISETEKRWPGYVILTIHDSIVIEAPLDTGQGVAEQISAYGAELMSDIFGVKMKVDIDRW